MKNKSGFCDNCGSNSLLLYDDNYVESLENEKKELLKIANNYEKKIYKI